MNITHILILCLLGHLVSDYTLQGWLADGKQKSWWEKLIPNLHETIYRNDYKAALLCHAMYWTICTFAVLIFTSGVIESAVMVLSNTALHYYVDDLKANKHKINLVEDQCLHLLQIIVTVGGWAL